MSVHILLALVLFRLHVVDALGNWTLQGCFTDSGGSRTLAAASLVDRNAMNLETCFAFCDQGGFNFAGVEFGSECYCDYAVQFPGTLSDVENCNMPCVGNSSQTCGAGDFLDVYWNGHPLPVIPTDLHGSSFLPWKYQGCFADNITDRVFPYQEIDTLPWNPGFCVVACETRGFTFAGLEFGNQCWCGHSLPVSPLLSDIECQMACAGNTSQICGGPERLTVYMAVDGLLCLAETQTPGFNLVAVYVDGSKTVPLHVINITTVRSTTFSILSTVPGNFANEELVGGAILPLRGTNITGSDTESIAIVPGDSPTFVTPALNTPPSEYCITPNPFLPTGPVTLSVSDHSELWALCPNSTANGRLDVVFDPIRDHPNYDQADCQSVYITFARG